MHTHAAIRPGGGSRRRLSAAGRGAGSGLQQEPQAVEVAVHRGDEDEGLAMVVRQGRVPLGLEQLSDMRFFEVSAIPRK